MSKVFLTGGNGFIGTHLLNELLKRGNKVYLMILPEITDFSALPKDENLNLVECDLKEISKLPAICAERDFDVFYHLAWIGSAGPGRADYALQTGNVKWACDAVKAAAEMGAKKFVGAGSIMEDEADEYLTQDDVFPSANYIYSAAKLTAHQMCRVVAAANNIEFCWGKISNAYGEGDNTKRFLQTMAEKLAAGEECNTTEGKQFYDFIYVTEVAKAFADIGEKGKNGRSYYIGTNEVAPLKEFILKMKDITKSSSKINFGAVPFMGAMLGIEHFDNQKLKNDTGFEAKISFEDGFKRYLEWLLK